jgi:SAM-dependent methyltransferase
MGSEESGGSPDPAALPRRVVGVQRHYTDHAAHPGADESPGRVQALPITRTILEWVGRGRRVLDLGCHEGDVAALIRAAGNELTGVDLPDIARKAREKHGLDAIGHDLNDPFPFPDGAFDVVVAASVLDDIPDDLGFLKECRRVLAPGGSLVVVVPNEVSLFRRVQFLLGRSSRDFAAETGYHTLHCYTLSGIRTLVEHSGFRVEEHRKCPKRFSRIPLRYWVERILPATFATDLAVRATRPAAEST